MRFRLVAALLLASASLAALAQPELAERVGALLFARGPWWRAQNALQARVGPTAAVPLLYLNTVPTLRVYNASLYLNVHVRVIVNGEIAKPDFDVPYKANGTLRVAIKGEDVLEWLLNCVEMEVGDPVKLEFPEQVEGYTLLNSTTMTVDPTVQADVWIYYAGAPSGGTQPPSQPGQQPSQPQLGGGGPSAAQPAASPVEEWVGRLIWWLAWAVQSLARWLAPLWPWWLLLLPALAALLAYLWWRSRRRFVLVIEVRGW